MTFDIMEQILIVEDDRGLSQGLCKALQAENRKIIADEGGYIKVSSVLGRGRTFSVFLPK